MDQLAPDIIDTSKAELLDQRDRICRVAYLQKIANNGLNRVTVPTNFE